jgi:hypothetical protein
VSSCHAGRGLVEPALVFRRLPNPLEVHSGSPVPGTNLCCCPGNSVPHVVQAGFLRRGGGISSVPWWFGVLCYASLAFLNLSKIWSFKCAMDTAFEWPVLSAAFPARASAFSFPGVPPWPLTQTMFTVFPRSPQTMFRILRATVWPGPSRSRVPGSGDCTRRIGVNSHVRLVRVLKPSHYSFDRRYVAPH